jgi:hypothetical protein
VYQKGMRGTTRHVHQDANGGLNEKGLLESKGRNDAI